MPVPTKSCVVVVSTCVDEVIITFIIMWCVVGRSKVITESELQHFHSWKVKLFTQRMYLFINIAKVFSNKGKVAELLLDRVKKFSARAFFPFSVNGSFFRSCYYPIVCECSEVIESQQIEVL